MKQLTDGQEIELKVKLLISLAKFGWTHVKGSTLLNTTVVAEKQFPVLNRTEPATIYLERSIDEHYNQCSINGEFVSRGENAMENIYNKFSPDATQEEIDQMIEAYITKAEKAISQSFGCRNAGCS